MLKVTKENHIGLCVRAGYDHAEILKFCKTRKAGEEGAIYVRYDKNYTSLTSWKCDEDGNPYFINSSLSHEDKSVMVRELGWNAAKILLSRHLKAA